MRCAPPTHHALLLLCALVPWHVRAMKPADQTKEAASSDELQPSSADVTGNEATTPQRLSCPVCYDDEPPYLLSPCGDTRHTMCERCAARIFAQRGGGVCSFCRRHVNEHTVIHRFRQLLQLSGREHLLHHCNGNNQATLGTIRHMFGAPTAPPYAPPALDDLTLHTLQQYGGGHVLPGGGYTVIRPRRRARRRARSIPPPVHLTENPLRHYDPECRMPRSERHASRTKRGAHGPRHRQTYAYMSPAGNAPPF